MHTDLQYVHNTLDSLQAKLHAQCSIRPTEIVVGGSLGHGTALPWKFDADIVIYSEGTYYYNVHNTEVLCCIAMIFKR